MDSATSMPGAITGRAEPRTGRHVAAGVALAAIALANVWVGARIPAVLGNTSIGNIVELERRAAAYPRERVKVLVLGNSEALAGLRPPLLSEALGLGRDAVFSLAMVGASVLEMRLMLERQLPAFPNVEQVLCGVNESFLTTNVELRARLLSSGQLDERLWLAEGQPLETRLRLVAGTWLPMLDFGASLREMFLSSPRYTIKSMFATIPLPEYTRLRDHPWGLQPPWSRYSARDLRFTKLRGTTPVMVNNRAIGFTRNAALTPASVRQLGTLNRELRARGKELLLVELPFTRALEAAIRRRDPASARRWRAALDALPAHERAPRVAAPILPDETFYDADHLAPEGARRIAETIARAVARQSLTVPAWTGRASPAGCSASPPGRLRSGSR